jgi:multiple sugar transport system permease protein
MKLHWRNVLFGKTLPYAILVVIGIAFLLPLLWVIVASFNPQANEALEMPRQWTIANYRSVLTDAANQNAFGVGLIMSLAQTVFVVLCAGLAAYPLSRYQLRYKRMFLYTILFMNSLPITAVMVPVYEEFVTIKLYDNIMGVILFFTASALPYGIWMMKNFMDSVPIELEEAAWVDGASTMTSLRKIVAPLMMPGIFTVAIFTFSGSWGNFFVPYILLSSASKLPASVKLYQFFGMHGMIAYGPLAAYSILYACPSVILYMISQKYMSQGFSMQGANKG